MALVPERHRLSPSGVVLPEGAGAAAQPLSNVFFVDQGTPVVLADQTGAATSPFATVAQGLSAGLALEDSFTLMICPANYSGEGELAIELTVESAIYLIGLGEVTLGDFNISGEVAVFLQLERIAGAGTITLETPGYSGVQRNATVSEVIHIATGEGASSDLKLYDGSAVGNVDFDGDGDLTLYESTLSTPSTANVQDATFLQSSFDQQPVITGGTVTADQQSLLNALAAGATLADVATWEQPNQNGASREIILPPGNYTSGTILAVDGEKLTFRGCPGATINGVTLDFGAADVAEIRFIDFENISTVVINGAAVSENLTLTLERTIAEDVTFQTGTVRLVVLGESPASTFVDPFDSDALPYAAVQDVTQIGTAEVILSGCQARNVAGGTGAVVYASGVQWVAGGTADPISIECGTLYLRSSRFYIDGAAFVALAVEDEVRCDAETERDVVTQNGRLTGTTRTWGVLEADRVAALQLEDADATLNVDAFARFVLPAQTLSANRTLTLTLTGTEVAQVFHVDRWDQEAFTLDVGGIQTLPASSARRAGFACTVAATTYVYDSLEML